MEEKDDDENSSLSTSLLVVTATTKRISKSSSPTNDNIDTTTNTTTHTTSVKEVTSKSKNKQQNLRLRHRHRRGRDEGGGGSGGSVCPNITTKCCYYCGMMGHDTGGCPTKMKDDEKRKNNKKKKRDEIKKQVSDHSLDAMHFKMYKPSKVLSQFVFTGKKLKGNKLLGEFYDFPSGIMSIGRLDANSEGLLLLTKCGKTSYKYTSPTSSTEKEYYVQVLGQMTFDDINKLCNGVNIQTRNETFTTAPCIVRLIDKKNDPYIQQFFTDDDEEELRQSKDDYHPSSNIICTGTSNTVTDDGSHHHHHHHHYPRHRRIKSTSWISITIKEGKFRQVRKMTASVGYPTLRLIRVRIGHITLFDVDDDDDDDNKDGNNNKKDKKMVNMMTPGQVIEIENL